MNFARIANSWMYMYEILMLFLRNKALFLYFLIIIIQITLKVKYLHVSRDIYYCITTS
jgi:hypothetical protein